MNSVIIGVEQQQSREVGDVFCNSEGDYYMLSRTDIDQDNKSVYALISLNDGDRWGDPSTHLGRLFEGSIWTLITGKIIIEKVME